MVTGSLPFLFDEEGNLLLLYESIMKCEFTIPSYVDPLCRNIINGKQNNEYIIFLIFSRNATKRSIKTSKFN